MRGKNFISILVLAFFAFIGGGSLDGGGLFIIGVILTALVIAAVIMATTSESKEQEEMDKKEKEDKEIAQKNTDKYNEDRRRLVDEYGDETLLINIHDMKECYAQLPERMKTMKDDDGEDVRQKRQGMIELFMEKTKSVDSSIIVYEPKSLIRIMGNMYNFKDILGVSVSDDQRIVHGHTVASTKTSTGSMIGRAVVGDLVAGPVGSIIGGSTASKNTTFTQEDDSVVHDYTIHINVNSIAEPIIHVNTWNDSELTNKIVGLINVIIERNK